MPEIFNTQVMRRPSETPHGKRHQHYAGCAVVHYHMFCQDMARFGWSMRKEERASALAIKAIQLGGWSDVK